MITLRSKVSISDQVLLEEVDGQAVLLNLENGKYYGLDKTGTRMWSLLSEKGELEPVCQALLAIYDVSEEKLRGDLLRLVDELATHGLLQVVDPEA